MSSISKISALSLLMLLWASYSHLECRESATVAPDTGIVHTLGTWTVTYAAGSKGVATGGGIKVQFPHLWHQAKRHIQNDNPTAPNYVAAYSKHTTLSISIDNVGLDWQVDDRGWITTVLVTGNALTSGETIDVVYGDISHGSEGLHAPWVTETDVIIVASDTNGDGAFNVIDLLPVISTLPEKPKYLYVFAPSVVTINQPSSLAVVVFDKHNNAAHYTGTIRFSAENATLPPTYTFKPEDKGIHEFRVTLHSPGVHTITVHHNLKGGHYNLNDGYSISNPIRCGANPENIQIYWGDIHSHSAISVDGAGRYPFEYARDVSRLDFYALSDHSSSTRGPFNPLDLGITDAEWETIKADVRRFYVPGEFVTILGYECSWDPPAGHHNVYFRDDNGPLLRFKELTLQEAWDILGAYDAITIPHHTGIIWKSNATVDFSYQHPLRTSIEVYSAHGSSEFYGNEMSYEGVAPRATSSPGPHYARDAWAQGNRLNIIASSDNHNSKPGQSCYGLTAVYAPELTREAIFDAMRAGHTYATTGQRILLDFRINGVLMGETCQTDKPPTIDVKVTGTDNIAWLEVVKYPYHILEENIYTVNKRVEPHEKSVTLHYIDETFQGDTMYYVRLQQEKMHRGRYVMAWASPIWVEKKQPAKSTTFALTLYPDRLNMIHIPVADPRFKRLSDLFEFLTPEIQALITYNTETDKFQPYTTGTLPGSPADIALKPYTGLIALVKAQKDVLFEGPPYQETSVHLTTGVNLIGLPICDPKVTKISELKVLSPNIKMVFAQDEAGRFVTSENVDIPIVGGQSFIVIVSEVVLPLNGEPWEKLPQNDKASPPIANRTDVDTNILIVQGTAIQKDTGRFLNGINIAVRNLATDVLLTDVSGSIGNGRFSVAFFTPSGKNVATVGDTLEIRAEGATCSSIKYIVTADDVRSKLVNLEPLVLTQIPINSALLQNYPNPFNPETWIPFMLAKPADVTLKIYNVKGKLVRTIKLGHTPAGTYKTRHEAAYWNGRNQTGEKTSSGVYFYMIEAGDFVAARKMILVK